MKKKELGSFFRIGVLPAILICAAVFLQPAKIAVPFLCAAAMHELGHLAAARLLGIRLRSLDIGPLGATIKIREGLISYKKEFLLCAAGPFVNLVGAAASAFIVDRCDAIEWFCAISLMLALLNLLPLSGFDGGRMLGAAIESVAGPRGAQAALSHVSFVTVVVLWILSVYLLMRFGSSLSLFIFCLSVFYRIFVENEKNKFF